MISSETGAPPANPEGTPEVVFTDTQQEAHAVTITEADSILAAEITADLNDNEALMAGSGDEFLARIHRRRQRRGL